jgi:hypothetical protein
MSPSSWLFYRHLRQRLLAGATVAGGAAVADAAQKASKSARRNASLALARRSNSRSLRS